MAVECQLMIILQAVVSDFVIGQYKMGGKRKRCVGGGLLCKSSFIRLRHDDIDDGGIRVRPFR